MTVRNVQGHANSALDSVPAVAVSSYLRKAWLPSPLPSLPSCFPSLAVAQCQRGPACSPNISSSLES